MFYANTFTLKMENKKMATKALEVMKEALSKNSSEQVVRYRLLTPEELELLELDNSTMSDDL